MVARVFLLLATGALGVGIGCLTGVASGAAPPDRFELSTELEARVATHQDLVEHGGRSPEDFCKLAADTVQILDPVALELSRFGGSEHSGVPFAAIQRAYKNTQWLVPGLILAASEIETQTGIDYRWLGKLAPAEARPLLRAMAGFEIGKEGIESWGVRTTDESACEAPDRGRRALAAVAKAWATAPACLKDALRARLSSELDSMVRWTCFCGAREPTEAAIRKSGGLLKGLADLNGTDLAERWLETVRAPDTRFNCSPG